MAPDCESVLRSQRLMLCVEQREAREKYRAAIRNLRERRTRLREIAAELMRIRRIEQGLGLCQDANGVVSVEPGARISAVLLELLGGSPGGMTVAQLSEALGGSVKKPTLSATLYNLKARNEIFHSKTTGRYRLGRLDNGG